MKNTKKFNISHFLSLAADTISPSLRVVNKEKTGPLCALDTTLLSTCCLHTYMSPSIAPVNVRLSWNTLRKLHPITASNLLQIKIQDTIGKGK